MIYNIASREILYKINEHSEEKIVSCDSAVSETTTKNDNSLRLGFNLAK